MVHNLIWAPDFFGPQEIWATRNMGPKKFGPPHENHHMAFSCWAQTSRGPKF